jgi:hypothetical protein
VRAEFKNTRIHAYYEVWVYFVLWASYGAKMRQHCGHRREGDVDYSLLWEEVIIALFWADYCRWVARSSYLVWSRPSRRLW